MFMNMRIIFLSALVFLAACSTSKKSALKVSQPVSSMVPDGKLFTSVFQQKAAEYKALCFQAYNIARMRLDQYPPSSNKPLAIITDIDETILDNSPYAVHQALLGHDYDQSSWYEWTVKGAADTVPGAPSFFKYAASKNVTIFYITNRDERERAGTLKNLEKYNLPFADSAHLILRQNASSKETRRQVVASSYEIALLLGDNLADFSNLFDKKTEEERAQNTRNSAAQFGNKFIVLPNPDYGDWESVLYDYNYKLTLAQKDSVLKSRLKGY
jgi:5'-nucleotidase (lipoprotein e(P4) family)